MGEIVEADGSIVYYTDYDEMIGVDGSIFDDLHYSIRGLDKAMRSKPFIKEYVYILMTDILCDAILINDYNTRDKEDPSRVRFFKGVYQIHPDHFKGTCECHIADTPHLEYVIEKDKEIEELCNNQTLQGITYGEEYCEFARLYTKYSALNPQRSDM